MGVKQDYQIEPVEYVKDVIAAFKAELDNKQESLSDQGLGLRFKTQSLLLYYLPNKEDNYAGTRINCQHI